MRVRNAERKRLDVLGSPQGSQKPELDAAAVRSWRTRIGYLSLFAGAATILASQAQDVRAGEADKAVPPHIKRQAAELLKKINSGKCSAPELLRRQSEYRLPNQQAKFNMVELLAGTDDCPGTPIPPGTYTSGAPFLDTGNTTGASSNVDFIQEGCSEYEQTAGPDHIYSFKISARGANPQVSVSTTSSTYDLSIYILNGTTGAMCPAGPGADVTNCLVGSDGVFLGATEVISASQMNTLPLNTQLHLFVDSYYATTGGSGATGFGPYTVRIQDVTVPAPVVPPSNDAPMDINADGQTDFVTLRNVGGGSSGQVRWYTSLQDGDPIGFTEWGFASDQFFADDYDGDGQDDFAVFRPGSPSFFAIVRSLNDTMYFETFGEPGDDASVVGDYNGDGLADLALYRGGATPADQSFWFYRPLGGGGFVTIPWGQGGDFPAPGDYDGDGKHDFVVQRTDGANGRFIKRMNTGEQSGELFGLKDDTIVPGDYDDDGKTDLAVVREEGGFLVWEFEPSGTPGSTVVRDTWGVAATDWIAQGDYDGDGRTDYAVWRPGSPGTFYIMTVGERAMHFRNWGEANDVPALNFNVH